MRRRGQRQHREQHHGRDAPADPRQLAEGQDLRHGRLDLDLMLDRPAQPHRAPRGHAHAGGRAGTRVDRSAGGSIRMSQASSSPAAASRTAAVALPQLIRSIANVLPIRPRRRRGCARAIRSSNGRTTIVASIRAATRPLLRDTASSVNGHARAAAAVVRGGVSASSKRCSVGFARQQRRRPAAARPTVPVGR